MESREEWVLACAGSYVAILEMPGDTIRFLRIKLVEFPLNSWKSARS